jgi:hypothetical protein
LGQLVIGRPALALSLGDAGKLLLVFGHIGLWVKNRALGPAELRTLFGGGVCHKCDMDISDISVPLSMAFLSVDQGTCWQ